MIIESFTYFSMDDLPARFENSFHVYDGRMKEIACELHGITMSYQQDEHAVSDDSAFVQAAAQPSSAIAPPPSSSYSVTVHDWSTCRATDPVQIVNFHIYISVDVALTESLVISTAVDISGGTLFANATMTQALGYSFTDQQVWDFNQWAVNNQQLPWQAGSMAISLAATWDVAGHPSMTRRAYYHLYDSNLQEVGCLYYSATMTAPSSSSATPLADKSSSRLLDNIAAARQQQPIQ